MRFITLLTLSLLIVTAACGSPEASQTVSIGIATDSPLYAGIDHSRFIDDLLHALSTKTNWSLTIKRMDTDQLVDALLTGKLDIIAPSTLVADHHELLFIPYLISGQTIAYTGNHHILAPRDLTGLTVGLCPLAASHPAVAELANLYQFSRLTYPCPVTALTALTQSNIDAVITDCLFIHENPSIPKIKTTGAPFTFEYYSFIVRSTDADLYQQLISGLQRLIRTGDYDLIFQSWFPDHICQGISPIPSATLVTRSTTGGST